MKKTLLILAVLAVWAQAISATTTSAHLFYGNPSDNFILRWHFQELCDHVFDPRVTQWEWPTSFKPGGARFNPKHVKEGDIVFARDLSLYFKEVHPAIKVPYILLTHGEYRDTCKGSDLQRLDDEKIIAWFGIHPCKDGHEKYFPIPLGIKQDNKRYTKDRRKSFNQFLTNLRETTPKTKMLYLNFGDKANPERRHVREFLENKRFCTTQETRQPFTTYLEEMAEHKFALSPRGWGPDCYRTWEALFVGTIPIVRRGVAEKLPIRSSRKSSQLDKLYEGLPVLVIDKWEQLTEQFLNEQYEKITARKYDISRLYIEYWYNQMEAVKEAYFSGKRNNWLQKKIMTEADDS